MANLNVTTGLLGVTLATIILVLLRRGHLRMASGAFWVMVAAVAVLLGLWPKLIDRLATFSGISYGPTLLLLGGLIVLFVKALHADMLSTRLEREVRRLNQRIAMLEVEVGGDDGGAGKEPRPR